MNDRIRRLYEMFLRVLTFMTASAADFQDIPFVPPTIAALQAETDTLGQLGAAKVTNTAAAKDSTVFRGDARDDLRDDLEYIAEVWRSIPDKTGGAANKFRLAPGNNDQNLIAAGKSFVAEAGGADIKVVLTEHGIPPTFITALQTKTDVFEQAVNVAQTAFGGRVGTNAAFDEPARRAKALVVKLAPAVKRKYRANPQKLSEWLVASHVEKPPATASKETPPVVK